MAAREPARYIPILRWKRGEARALEQLDAEAQRSVSPLLEVPNVPWDYVNGLPSTSLEDHLTKATTLLGRSWGSRVAFADLGLVPAGERMGDGRHPVEYFHDLATANGAAVVPVTGPGRDAAQKTAVRRVCRGELRGACVRCTAEDFLR